MAGVERLVGGVGFLEGLFGCDVVGEPHFDRQGQFGLRRVRVGGDGHRRERVTGYLALQFEVAAFAQDSQSCLARVEVADALGEVVAELRIDQSRVVGEVGDGNRVNLGVVDRRAIELVTDEAGGE